MAGNVALSAAGAAAEAAVAEVAELATGALCASAGETKGTAKASASALASGVLVNMWSLCKARPGRTTRAKGWRARRGLIGWLGRPKRTGEIDARLAGVVVWPRIFAGK
ncbi:hypothetical protein PUN4_120099 [Paraburkholderia unamae]|nr:hypothetical protein PUN4_120099 [Paraburkholderia unamae]